MDYSFIPKVMRSKPQWAIANGECNQSIKGVDKKRPYYFNGRQFLPVATNNPRTFMTFEDAVRYSYGKRPIGFIIQPDDNMTCLDLDEATHPDVLKRDPDFYKKIVDHFNSYTDHSWSGNSHHIWIRGKISRDNVTDPKTGVGVYSGNPQFIIFANPPYKPLPIENRQQMLEEFVHEHFPLNRVHVTSKDYFEPDMNVAMHKYGKGGATGMLRDNPEEYAKKQGMSRVDYSALRYQFFHKMIFLGASSSEILGIFLRSKLYRKDGKDAQRGQKFFCDEIIKARVQSDQKSEQQRAEIAKMFS